MTQSNDSNSSLSQLLREGETYRLLELDDQLKAPTTPLVTAEEKFNQAIDTLQKIPQTQISATQKEQLAWAYAHLGAAKFQQALILRDADQVTFFDQAKDAFDNAVHQKPQYPWAFAHQGQALIYKALLFLEQIDNPDPNKNPKELLNSAIKSLQTAIDQSGKRYAWAYAQLGVAYRWLLFFAQDSHSDRENYINQSLNAFDTAIEQNSQYVWAYAYRNIVRHIKKDFSGAWDDLMQAIELNPNIASTFRNINLNALSFAPSRGLWANDKLKEKKDDPIALYIFALEKAQKEGLEAAKAAIEQARSSGVA